MPAWRVSFTCTPTEPPRPQPTLSDALKRHGGRAVIDGGSLTIEVPLYSDHLVCLEQAGEMGRYIARRAIFNAGLIIAMETGLTVMLAPSQGAVTELPLPSRHTERPPAA